MKKISWALATVSLVSLNACKQETAQNAPAAAMQSAITGAPYTLDTAQSFVDWKGYKVVKTDQTSHFGKIKLSEGQITMKDGRLESGKFIADMTTLSAEDLASEPEQKAKLEGHLKAEDFFEVTKFPTAKFEVTKVEPSTDTQFGSRITGNLTIKGITRAETFNASVTESNGMVNLKSAPIEINRRSYGVNFTSPAANGLIKDEMTLQLNLVAKAK